MLRPPTPARPESPVTFPALDTTDLSNTPFGDDSIAAIPAAITPPRLSGTKSQPLPSLDRILRPDVDIEFNRRDPSKPPIRLKRKSTMFKAHDRRKQQLAHQQSQSATLPARSVRRNCTWSGSVRTVSLEGALSSPLDAREVWADHSRTLTTHLIPGSLAFHQNLPIFTSREEPTRKRVWDSVHTHPLPEAPFRAKSQPVADIEGSLFATGVSVRRSASLHSMHSSSTLSTTKGVSLKLSLRKSIG
jgi:hypothetical protein